MNRTEKSWYNMYTTNNLNKINILEVIMKEREVRFIIDETVRENIINTSTLLEDKVIVLICALANMDLVH